MIIHTREFGYGSGYSELFEGINKWKAAVLAKYPELLISVMYNLAGERGRLTVQTSYPSLGDYEKIEAALDADEEIGALMGPLYEHIEPPLKDQFYKVVS